jgi:hypothetical protein
MAVVSPGHRRVGTLLKLVDFGLELLGYDADVLQASKVDAQVNA